MDESVTSGGRGPIRLLLVDDHPTSREPLAILLSREEDMMVAGEAGTLADVRQLLAAGLEIDVALLDLDLPDGDGIELIYDLRRADSRIISIVLTGSRDRRHYARAIDAGAAHFMHKSATTRQIIDAIRRLVAGEVLLDPRETAELIRQAGELRARHLAEQVALGRLTTREREVLLLLADGLDNQAIADRLHIGLETVRTHVANVMGKLGAESRLHAVLLAYRQGLVRLD